ncbi:MAG: hypothetical protein C0453_19175, partial [Comamonadaceae bacterium]|nr:hypothetical protein [Comamonadaceae bacterium]
MATRTAQARPKPIDLSSRRFAIPRTGACRVGDRAGHRHGGDGRQHRQPGAAGHCPRNECRRFA